MRLFLAINIDPAIRRAVADATEPLRVAAPSLAWIAEPKLHLTLKFLGETEPDAAARLGPAMDAVASRHRPFAMRLRHVGAFPNFRRARVVWMGVEPSPRLELLHHDVEVACADAGFPLDGRPFRPHVTIARVRQRPEEPVLRALSRAAKRVDYEEEMMVGSIDLMRSTQGSAGSSYDRLHASPLDRD